MSGLDRGIPVVTAVGLVTAAGVGLEACWRSLEAPPPPPGVLRRFPVPELEEPPCREVEGWDPGHYWVRRRTAHLTRSAQFTLRAAEICLEGLEEGEREALGIVSGSHLGSIHHFGGLLSEPDFMTPLKFLATLPSSTPTNVSIACGLRGISTAVSSPTAGLEALGYALDLVADGYHPAVLAGGAEELSPELYGGCLRGGLLAGPRCSGGRRRGIVPGEGAAVLLVEDAAVARRRGRRPLASLAGWAATHAPASSAGGAEGAVRALEGALLDAGVQPREVDLLVTSGVGDRRGDRTRRRALAELFGERLPVVLEPAAWWGETFGAAGALAAAVAAAALGRGACPGGGAVPRCAVVHDAGWDGSHQALVLVAPGPGQQINGGNPGARGLEPPATLPADA